MSWCQRYFYMIADEGFSESFNKCWQNIQMNFSFSHTVNRIKGQYKICWLKRCLGCKYEWNYVSLISILYLLNNNHFCQTKWSYKTLFTPISAIKKFTVSKGRKEWQKFSIVTGSLLFIIIGGRFLTVTIFSWEMFTVPYC